MKIFLYSILLVSSISSSTSYAQLSVYQPFIDSIPFDNVARMVKYEGEERVPGNKKEVFNKTKMWLSQAFDKSSHVTLAENRSLYCVTGKIIMPYEYVINYSENGNEITSGEAQFTINIFAKNNKYRYIISDIGLKDSFSPNPVPWSKDYMNVLFRQQEYGKTYYSLFSGVNTKMNNIINSLKKSLSE